MKTGKKFSSRSGRFCSGIAAALLLLPVITGCTGTMILDVTPPADTLPTQQAASSGGAQVDVSPLLPPDPAAGKLIYGQECAACHGENGMSDGPRSASLPSMPQPLGSLSYSRSVPPSRWFQVITQGRIDKLMPAYSTSLSDRQRWDTVAYLMTLGTTSGQIASGRQIFQQNCQDCHRAESSTVNGQSTPLNIPDLFHRSVDDLIPIMSTGSVSIEHEGTNLSDEDRLDTALYLQTLFFARETSDGEETETPPDISASKGETVTITGHVVNGSGGPLPAGLAITLTAYEDNIAIFTEQTGVGGAGQYVFDRIPSISSRTFEVSTRYKNSLYTSGLIHAGSLDEIQNSLVTIYEPDTDITQISAKRVHVFFEFPRSDTIRVVQLYVLSNPTNQLITSNTTGGVVIDYPLPAGAANLQFQTGTLGQRFIPTRDGVGDTRGIPPGDGTQVLFSYDLPYRGDTGFSVTVPVESQTVNVLLAAEGVGLKSRQLQEIGEKVIQNSNWRLFTAANVPAGTDINVQISGKPKVTTPQENEMSNSLAAGIISLVVVLVLIGTVIFRDVMDRRTRKQETSTPRPEPVDRNAILDAIIALDDQFQAGQIPVNAYRERREELKDRYRRTLP
jgi:mono/diheme cytochrome c family protein